MGFECGIVGLPNVGKSTLFNALTCTVAAQAANYPFCTIEPNRGDIAVPDPRLEEIARMTGSARILPTRLTFVDIAGLVRGAAKGEGLGNKFLMNIRQVDAIAHVLRCFEDDNVSHVHGRIDPLEDASVVETELILADMESLERRIETSRKRAKGREKEAMALLSLMEGVLALLEQGRPARDFPVKEEEQAALRMLQLLTSKPILYVCNVSESCAATGNTWTRAVTEKARAEGAPVVVVSAAIEAEIAQLPAEEQRDYLSALGLESTGLSRVVLAGYSLLDLITYFTSGPKETRAWTIPRGTKAPRAAGVIHTDFERGFIRAQTISYADYIRYRGEAGAREAGKVRDEGKDYVVQDGDILLFKFNV